MIYTEDFGKILWEVMIFLTYISVCCSLTRLRFSKSIRLAMAGGMLVTIVLEHVWIFYSCRNITKVLTMLPLTAYVPSILCLHIVSASGFFQTVAVWTTGLISRCILKILLKILMLGFFDIYKPAAVDDYVIFVSVCLFLAASLLLFLVFRFLSGPFRTYVQGSRTDWLILCFPVLMVVLLFSYIGTNAESIMLLLFLFLIVLGIFFMLVKALVTFDALRRIKLSEQQIAASLQAQRREYEDLNARMEAGRIYRHDMRHHLTVLENLAKEDDSARILEYVGNLLGQLSGTERKAYCENITVNAILSAYLQEAEKDCEVETQIHIPEELQYDEMDVCAVLANALENARNECKKIEEAGKRRIRVKTELKEEWKFFISVENSCSAPITFGKDGLPDVVSQGGHGIGLKSIDAIVKKYRGMLQCECSGGVFRLNAVLFRSKEEEQTGREAAYGVKKLCPKKAIPVAAGIALAGFFICSILFLADASGQKQSAVKSDSAVIRTIQWGDLVFRVELPGILESDAVQEGVEAYIHEMEIKFLEYAQNKYMGFTGMDITHEILRDDAGYLSIRFDATLNAGGSGQYSRCFTLDKQSGRLVQLSDLAGEDYIKVISAEILRQMEEQVGAGKANYFIPGGIWSEDECFKQIAPDQNFYIDGEGGLVIVFDEYEVAPGSMGMPEFVIPWEILGQG